MFNQSLSSNIDLCLNTILYLVGLQTPGNYKKILNYGVSIKKISSNKNYDFIQIEKPNLSNLDLKFDKLDPIKGSSSFVVGYISKIIDLNITNNIFNSRIYRSDIKQIYLSIFNPFYKISSEEIFDFAIFNNQNIMFNSDYSNVTSHFGLGSYAAIWDHQLFERDFALNNGYLYSFLSENDNTLLTRNLENVLIAQFNKKEIFKNHLFINSLSIKHKT